MKLRKRGMPFNMALKEVFGKIRKHKVKIVMLAMSIGFALSCLQLTMNYVVAYGNTESIKNDSSLVEVESISQDGVVTLQTGEVLQEDDIDCYAKVLSGGGTWYSFESNCLVTEVTIADVMSVSKIAFLYFLLTVGFTATGVVKKWIYKTGLGRIYLIVSITLSVYMLYLMYLLVG